MKDATAIGGRATTTAPHPNSAVTPEPRAIIWASVAVVTVTIALSVIAALMILGY